MIKLTKKLLVVAVAVIAIITISSAAYIWLTKEGLPPDNQDTGTIEGAITDYQGTPLVGINIAIVDGTTSYPETTVETDEEGHYQIEGIPPGDFEVAFYDSQEIKIGQENVTVTSGKTSTLDFSTPSNSTCPEDDSTYKWTYIGTFSENFNWINLQNGHTWTNTLPENEYESWKNQFLEPDFIRDYTLLYLKTELQMEIPDPLTLEWTGGRETPEHTLGYETYVYKAANIEVTIGYPVVLPENTIYEIEVTDGDLTLWKGQLHCREFTSDNQTESTLYDYYGGVSLFEKGIHVSATTHNPLITETTNPPATNEYWQQIHENLTDNASTEDFISIIISRGDYPTGGYTLEIKQFSWLESYPVKFRFQIDFVNPGEDVIVTQALTNPLVLFPIGKLTAGEYHIEVHILTYILTFDEEGNPIYTQLQTFKEEVWTKTFTIQ